MPNYLITVERYETGSDRAVAAAMIDCVTPYTLETDLAEWVRVEIDPKADIDEWRRDSESVPTQGS